MYCVGDICIRSNDETFRLMNIREIKNKFGDVPMPECVRLLSAVESTLIKFQIDASNIKYLLPYRPAILDLLFISKKGCNGWTKLTRKGFSKRPKVALREQKWDEVLGGFRGVDFWDSLYRNMEHIEYDNRVKWFQYQINRLILKTNETVSKFIPNIMTLCNFCGHRSETVLHLLWECPVVNSFYRQVLESVRESVPMYYWPMERTSFIFLMVNKKMYELNMFTLYLKLFVWKQKHKRLQLHLMAFHNYFNHELKIIKKAFRGNPRYDRLMQI